MDKQAFFKSVHGLREAMVKGFTPTCRHKYLDDIVHNVLGDEDMDTEIEALTETVIKLIRRIKKAKENEQLATKATEIIEKIKAEIDND